MYEHLENSQADDFIKLFEEFKRTVDLCSRLKNEGKDYAFDRLRLNKLEVRVNRAFKDLGGDVQGMIVDMLTLGQPVKDVRDIMGGRVERIGAGPAI